MLKAGVGVVVVGEVGGEVGVVGDVVIVVIVGSVSSVLIWRKENGNGRVVRVVKVVISPVVKLCFLRLDLQWTYSDYISSSLWLRGKNSCILCPADTLYTFI